MKTIKFLSMLLLLFYSQLGMNQENSIPPQGYWQIGIGLGELPTGGSFKPSFTIGYHINDNLYIGVIYQLKDKIQRDDSSFNAQSSDLNGLISSSETVAQHFLLQLRYTPFKNGPYLSSGIVYNGKDTESMLFDSSTRVLSGENYEGTIDIHQTRPAGWSLALGLGYQYNFKNGLSAGFEWTPAWVQYPTPSYVFGGTSSLSGSVQNDLQKKMDDGFKSSVTNMYKVFHIGLAYRFQ